jgi:universal stress protein E
MHRYTKIAVGIDLEPDGRKLCLGSRRAVSQAKDVASRTGASIAFLHSTFREPGDPLPSYHDQISRELSPDAWAVLESTSHEFADENIHTSLHFSSEPAWLEMSRWAKRRLADLVIVGKKSSTVGDRRQIGTIATNLIRKCPAPVWFVHPDREPGDGCVLAATDLSPAGHRATEMAQYINALYGTELHILHSHQVPMSVELVSELDGGDGGPRSRLDELEEQIRRGILASLEIDETAAQVHVVRDNPSNAVSTTLKQLNPNLLVMGSLSKTGAHGQLLGNSAERAFRIAECSLLTVKPEQFTSPVE